MSDKSGPTQARLFSGLTGDEADRLNSSAKLIDFAAGQELLVAGRECPGLFILRSGAAAAIISDSHGLEHEVGMLGSGDSAGEMALLTGEACSATVRAVSAGQAWFVGKAELADAMERSPELWRSASQLLSQRLVNTSRNLAVQPRQNLVALVSNLPHAIELSLALDVADRVASRSRTLLIIDRAIDAEGLRGRRLLPSMAELLANRSLARHHENDGNSSTDASVAMVSGDGGPVSQHDLLAALGPVRSNYKQIILLTDSDRIAEFDVSHAPRVSVVLPGEEVEIPHWLSSMIDKGFEVEASILWPVASSRLIETLEVRTGKAVARLLATVHQLGQDSRQRRDAVSRLARRFSRTEIGLALGSGAARGFAHVGVLQVFEEEGLPIDYIAGCSIGSVVGGLYASGTDPNSIGKLMHGADRKLTRWTWPIASLWSNSGLTSLLKNNGGKVRFSELNVPFAAVACDVTTAEAVVIRRGTVWKAVRASVSVPIMFPATLLTRRWLTDGGLVNPIPNDAARGLGADIVIGVDLLSPAGRARQGAKKRIVSRAAAGRVPNLIDMIWRSMEIMQEEITLRSASFADVTVEPDLGQVRWKDFSLRGEDFIAEGVRAAREKMPEIRQRIGTWR